MYQKIHEAISVIGVYKNSKFKPKKFYWRSKIYCIDQITLWSNIKDGGAKKRLYSVLARGNLYRLCFNRENETWFLEEIWCE
jgi:hypothetical protein